MRFIFDKSSLTTIFSSPVAADNYISSLLDSCQYVIEDITLDFSNQAGLLTDQMDIDFIPGQPVLIFLGKTVQNARRMTKSKYFPMLLEKFKVKQQCEEENYPRSHETGGRTSSLGKAS